MNGPLLPGEDPALISALPERVPTGANLPEIITLNGHPVGFISAPKEDRAILAAIVRRYAEDVISGRDTLRGNISNWNVSDRH